MTSLRRMTQVELRRQIIARTPGAWLTGTSRVPATGKWVARVVDVDSSLLAFSAGDTERHALEQLLELVRSEYPETAS